MLDHVADRSGSAPSVMAKSHPTLVYLPVSCEGGSVCSAGLPQRLPIPTTPIRARYLAGGLHPRAPCPGASGPPPSHSPSTPPFYLQILPHRPISDTGQCILGRLPSLFQLDRGAHLFQLPLQTVNSPSHHEQRPEHTSLPPSPPALSPARQGAPRFIDISSFRPHSSPAGSCA